MKFVLFSIMFVFLGIPLYAHEEETKKAPLDPVVWKACWNESQGYFV